MYDGLTPRTSVNHFILHPAVLEKIDLEVRIVMVAVNSFMHGRNLNIYDVVPEVKPLHDVWQVTLRFYPMLDA